LERYAEEEHKEVRGTKMTYADNQGQNSNTLTLPGITNQAEVLFEMQPYMTCTPSLGYLAQREE